MSADVQGRCPACGSSSLFLGSGGYVTCRVSDCSDPSAASDLLTNSGLLKATEQALVERNERLDRIERLARGEHV